MVKYFEYMSKNIISYNADTERKERGQGGGRGVYIADCMSGSRRLKDIT
jgi:hypothetical protein